ncbi:hypothetical protein BCR43DRAFT_528034 [Syncephalastrum racemosum]|uniref:Uncharacterized protein n=1 Tax=Syncephalastrum racemosum TaxID=13706 RepID=A0A1X2GZY4_SYNRA|nr:hypothetical protein BCR43DRAFT_528034 [Syncephalastrum racemosum]
MLQNPSTSNSDSAMSLLSTYMLQGWVMTNEKCKVPECYVPIMRSKDGSVHFCVTHDTLPTQSASSSSSSSSSKPAANIPTPEKDMTPPAKRGSISEEGEDSEEQPAKRTAVPNADEQRIARERREQSSRASELIGKRLLQRWALLNDVCPNPACYAIPLMRDPSKRMTCVICERVYLTEEQAAEEEKKKKKQASIAPPAPVAPVTPATPPVATPTSTPATAPAEPTRAAPVSVKQEVAPQTTARTHGSFFHADVYSGPIKRQLDALTAKLECESDPTKLKLLFEAITAGAVAIRTCAETEASLSH